MMPAWLTPETITLLWRGLLLTLALTLATTLLSMLLGILAGASRLSKRPNVRTLSAVYIEMHRNVPALVLIIIWAFALPNLFPAAVRQSLFFDNVFIIWLSSVTGLSLPYYALAAGVALSLNTSAYIAEQFRAGVGTIPQEHVDAARSMGASTSAVFWQILLLEGLRASFPAISTRLIHNMKNTALAAFVSVPEFFQGTQTAITRTFQAFEFLLLAAVVYLVLAFFMTRTLHFIDGRLHQRRPSKIFQ